MVILSVNKGSSAERELGQDGWILAYMQNTQKIRRPTSRHVGQTNLVNEGFVIRTKNTIF